MPASLSRTREEPGDASGLTGASKMMPKSSCFRGNNFLLVGSPIIIPFLNALPPSTSVGEFVYDAPLPAPSKSPARSRDFSRLTRFNDLAATANNRS